MCKLLEGQDPASHIPTTRRLRINGHGTSIRLEQAFWQAIDEIAAEQGMTTPAFLTRLHDEVLDIHGEVGNFTSLLRCACLFHLSDAPRLRTNALRQ
ncbi:MAG: ribbon-helix-helix domain-containing protein [Rhodobacteraceae bacterium]|nr:ribbon-helix-helix domain-containing protein [Paracoccaceae bacterium]